MRGPETRLYKKIKKAIEVEYPGSWVRKIHGNQFQNRGIPDLLCCIKTRPHSFFAGMEVKVPGKHATPIQEHELSQIRLAGGAQGEVHSVKEALSLIRKFKKYF
jgi:hypothetical protein